MRAGELDDAAAVEAAAQVLEGLAHAHARGIVHRDVKPANVLLADGAGVSVKLLDFGLALIAEEETLTAVGDVPGTLAYISPERLSGEQARPAADVWAVGVMLWEALAGTPPVRRRLAPRHAKKIGRARRRSRPRGPTFRAPHRRSSTARSSVDPSKRPPRRAARERAAQRRRAAAQAAARRARRRASAHGAASAALERARPRRPRPRRRAARRLDRRTLPFFPAHWPLGLASLAARLTASAPRLGLAFALAVPVLPLGNSRSAWRSSTASRPAPGSRSSGRDAARRRCCSSPGPLLGAARRARAASARRPARGRRGAGAQRWPPSAVARGRRASRGVGDAALPFTARRRAEPRDRRDRRARRRRHRALERAAAPTGVLARSARARCGRRRCSASRRSCGPWGAAAFGARLPARRSSPAGTRPRCRSSRPPGSTARSCLRSRPERRGRRRRFLRSDARDVAPAA